MSRATLWKFSLALIFFSVGLSGCALFEDRTGPATYYGPREQVFFANFEEVWRAVNLVLQPYPLRVSNMDQGTLETDTIRGYKVWGPPYRADAGMEGQTYKLNIRVIKGVLNRHPATKVTIVKDTEKQIDFFSEPKAVASDGMEEKVILYRIAREIQIERALAHEQKKMNQKQKE